MNNKQLQYAIDKYVEIIVEGGSKLQHYHPHFYEKLTSVTIKLMHIQAERAAILVRPMIGIKE